MFFFLWNGLALEKYYSRSCIRSAWLGLAMGDKRQGHCGILAKKCEQTTHVYELKLGPPFQSAKKDSILHFYWKTCLLLNISTDKNVTIHEKLLMNTLCTLSS